MQDTLKFLVKKAIGENVEVGISEESDDFGGTNYIVEIEDEFKPRLIGKRGRTITSIYNLLKILARKENKRVYVKVKD